MESQEGDGSGNSHRLPSFTGPRALKLGAQPSRVSLPGRRMFVPNVTASRDVNDTTTVKKEGSRDSKRSSGQPYPPRGRGDKRGGYNNRGGKRDFARKTELLQSEGAIFGEGIGSKNLLDSKVSTKASSTNSSGFFRGSFSSGKAKDSLAKGNSDKPAAHLHSQTKSDELLTEDHCFRPRMIPIIAEDISPLLQQLQLSSTGGSAILLRVPENLPLMKEEENIDEASTAIQNLISHIASFPEGPLGSMELTDECGTLAIGENEFSVEPGTHAEFHQELLLVNDDSLTSLGSIRHKFICRTTVESLIFTTS